MGHLFNEFPGLGRTKGNSMHIELGNCPGREEVTLRIDLPDGWHLEHPRAFASNTFDAGIDYQQHCREENNTLVIERTLELTRAKIPPEDYSTWRTILLGAQTNNRQPLVLLKAN